MAKLHKKAKKGLVGSLIRKTVGENTFDQAHFLGTSAVKMDDAAKEAERAAKEAANEPVMPIPDEDALMRARRKRLQRGNRGRASTIFGDESGSETLG